MELCSINGLGIRRILSLRNHFSDPADILTADVKSLMQIPGFEKSLAESIHTGIDKIFVDEQLKVFENSPFDAITIFDNEYPHLLRKIYDPPVMLYKHGDFIDKDHDAIGIVGTRNCSEYGKAMTEELTRELVNRNITIVSGFARGIDTAAHTAALRFGGRTIAVLGNGIDKVYPTENRKLRQDVIENGVYCSEFPFGTKPDAGNFPRRNRIISGFSLGIIVIEAAEKSGSLLTAYNALEQNREVFALPGRLTDKYSLGTNRLIQQGAKLILSPDDIIDEIENLRKFPTKPRQTELNFEFSQDEKKIYDNLDYDGIHIDELSAKCETSTQTLLGTLLSMELKGAVRQLAGKRFTRIG